jgi:hypothetical protein
MHASVLFMMLSFSLGMHAKDDSKHTSELHTSARMKLNILALVFTRVIKKFCSPDYCITFFLTYFRLQERFCLMLRKYFFTYLLAILSKAIVMSLIKAKLIFSAECCAR